MSSPSAELMRAPSLAGGSGVGDWSGLENGLDRNPEHGLEREVVGLFHAYRRRLLGYAKAFGITGPDAEEVVQEVFLALFRHLLAGKPQSNLRGWIFRVAHLLALKQRAANQRRMRWMPADELADARAFDPAPDPEQTAITAERQSTIRAVLAALPEQDRLCFTLRAEGLTYREIAHVQGVSLGSVAQSLTRSLGRLMRAG